MNNDYVIELYREPKKSIESRLVGELDPYSVSKLMGILNVSDEDFYNQNPENLFDDEREKLGKAIQEFFWASIESNKKIFKEKVCIDLKYCEKKKFFDKNGELIYITSSLADIIVSLITNLPVSASITLSVYIIRTRVLDKICACEGGD